MKTRLLLTLAIVALTTLVIHPANAQLVSNGPYYATPAWDQTFACTTVDTCPRFIELSNLMFDAVLDRETGLVWERSPATTFFPWSAAIGLRDARNECTSRTTGGRKGWRLPSVHELASLVDPNKVNPALPPGHPFANVQSSDYWSATTDAGDPSFAWSVNFSGAGVGSGKKSDSNFVWCVRGGMNADQY